MRIPLSWVRDYVDLPGRDARPIGDRLVSVGLELEEILRPGGDVTGTLVVGRVRSIEELTEFKKPIRWCQVEVRRTATPTPRACAESSAERATSSRATSSSSRCPVRCSPAASRSPRARPTATCSDGMICSERELGLGDDHAGIIVLPEGSGAVGEDAGPLVGLGDAVLDVSVTPDMGFCLSMRGVARELAHQFSVPFRDPGTELVALPAPVPGDPHECVVDDLAGCDLFTLRTLVGFDPKAPSPYWMRRRLTMSGMRPVSLAVDVTNYVMLETGQPLHAFDRAKLRGPIVVRRAREGEKLETLDHVTRPLETADLLITDARGPIGLAGTMGGLDTEIDDGTSEIALEAAHFAPRLGGAHVSTPQAVQRGVQALRARRRRRAGAVRLRPGSSPPARARWRQLRRHDRRRGAARGGRHRAPGVPSRSRRGHRRRARLVVERLEAVGCAVADPSADPLSSLRRRGGTTSPIPPTSSRRCCDSAATSRSRAGCPRLVPASASRRRSAPVGGSAGRWLRPATSRRWPIPSSARRSSTRSAFLPTTRAGRCCCWPTRSPTSSPACVRRCSPAFSPPCGATSAAARATSPCSSSVRSSCSATGRGRAASPTRRGPTWRTGRRPTSSPRSRPCCRRSPCTWRWRSPASARPPAGGARAADRRGPTRSRRRAWSPTPSGSASTSARARRRRPGIRDAAQSSCSGLGSSAMPASWLHACARARGCPRARQPWSSISARYRRRSRPAHRSPAVHLPGGEGRCRTGRRRRRPGVLRAGGARRGGRPVPWSPCGSSTSTPASRWEPGASRWRSRCASAHPTARSRSRRSRPRAATPWPRQQRRRGRPARLTTPPTRLIGICVYSSRALSAPIVAAVVGASGYAGGEVVRLLLGHPRLEVGPLLRRRQRRPAGHRPAPAVSRRWPTARSSRPTSTRSPRPTSSSSPCRTASRAPWPRPCRRARWSSTSGPTTVSTGPTPGPATTAATGPGRGPTACRSSRGTGTRSRGPGGSRTPAATRPA